MRFLVLALFFLPSILQAEELLRRVKGTCEEVRGSFKYEEKDEVGGTITYEGREGSIGTFCEGGVFRSTLILFQLGSKEEAILVFDSIKSDLLLNFGDIDKPLTQKHAETYYMTMAMSKKPGVVGTLVSQKWGPSQNHLELKLDQVGGKWAVVVSFGEA